ncbi:MAG: hypothetical protein JJU28_06355 [Cyclobacteriaceae bacterium]|nr:hypothetical protein [Cyclobacteriaceae bacterium]
MRNIHIYKTGRRAFIKTAPLTALTGGIALSACGRKDDSPAPCAETFPIFNPALLSEKGPVGLLFSQLGYEPGWPVRLVLRAPGKDYFQPGTICRLRPCNAKQVYETTCDYWGEVWGEHWWQIEFKDIPKGGTWSIEIVQGDNVLISDREVLVEQGCLWNQTIHLASADMLERRSHFTKVGAGWQDAGALWVESPAQSAMIISLTEIIESSPFSLDKSLEERLFKQIVVGCDYLVMTQKKAREMGYDQGAFTHDLHGNERFILPNDANKACVALFRAARLLPDMYAEKKEIYLASGLKAFRWLTSTAQPIGIQGLEPFQRGISNESRIPSNEWPTRDLVMMAWAALEKWRLDSSDSSKAKCIEFVRKVMLRQIPKENGQMGFYGHFREFDSLPHSESSWVHGIKYIQGGTEFGVDIGGFYPNYLIPIIDMLKSWPDHEDAGRWLLMLRDFADGFLKPACKANPFYIVPLGIFEGEGPIWFCGTFHGSNAIYGYTAALAMELSKLLDDQELRNIAYGNLQWITGLNSGITSDNIKMGCVIYSADLPEGIALPASMICQVGQRWAGTWFQTRGVICNGFSNGEQFKYDIPVKKEYDAPLSFTDEDWIPHSAGWITGLVKLYS